jgi:hypothetical protein
MFQISAPTLGFAGDRSAGTISQSWECFPMMRAERCAPIPELPCDATHTLRGILSVRGFNYAFDGPERH